MIYFGQAVLGDDLAEVYRSPYGHHDDEVYMTLSDHFRVTNTGTPTTSVSPKLIGLSGLAGSGKTAVAKILVQNHGFVRIRFADTIKKMLRTLLVESGCTEEEAVASTDGYLKETKSRHLNWQTPRHALQTLGTEWGRDCIHRNIWADLTGRTAVRLLAEGKSVVIDDTRFPNEVDTLTELGGVIVKVVRPEGVTLTDTAKKHISEQHQLHADKILVNRGSLEDLSVIVNDVLGEL